MDVSKVELWLIIDSIIAMPQTLQLLSKTVNFLNLILNTNY